MLKERNSSHEPPRPSCPVNNGNSSPCSNSTTSSTVDTTTTITTTGHHHHPATSCCGGCGGRINDRYYLLAVDRQWHAHCLKCAECHLPLDGELTCFARDGSIYCKEDYYRMFSVSRCGRCHSGISANELVMRARDTVYHLHCFSCSSCGIPLSKGDHFGMRSGLVYCRPHYELLDFCDPTTGSPVDLVYHRSGGGGGGNSSSNHPGVGEGGESPSYYSNTSSPHNHLISHHSHGGGGKGRPRKQRKLVGPEGEPCGELPVTMRMATATLEMLQGDLSSASMDSLSYDSSVTSPASSTGHGPNHQRTKRMRTSFKHHQLRTMKTYFAINQNPDAKDLKQLAQKTGLSKRVLQVWFQNARAKWRRNIMRQESGNQNINTPGNPAGNVNSLLNESNSLSHQSIEDIHSHLHNHSSSNQTLTFSDIY